VNTNSSQYYVWFACVSFELRTNNIRWWIKLFTVSCMIGMNAIWNA